MKANNKPKEEKNKLRLYVLGLTMKLKGENWGHIYLGSIKLKKKKKQ